MKRIIIREPTPILPFGEPARDLRILNKALWLHQRDLLARHCKGASEVDSLAEITRFSQGELLIHKDNLFFNAKLIDTFVSQARATQQACQIAFAKDDRTITAHALRLQDGIRLEGEVYLADLYYYPSGERQPPKPLVIATEASEMGYYHIPSYMANQGDLVFQVPLRAFLSIENWVHVFLANTPLGVFNWARQTEDVMNRGRLRDFLHWQQADWQALRPKIALLLTALGEKLNPFEAKWRNHFLACKNLVKIGKNCSIDPTAIIHGPTVLGDNVYVGPGAVITNSLIGSNVNIMQGSQVMLSVISDRCFLPFNAGVFMSTLMEDSTVAQNTTLQLCVVGRNSFLGANNVCTDLDLFGQPIQTYHKSKFAAEGELQDVGLPVLGSAIGHHCKIGSGFILAPGRMVGSYTTLVVQSNGANLIQKCVNVPNTPSKYNVPGQNAELAGQTDEARQTIYFWPRLSNPAATPEASVKAAPFPTEAREIDRACNTDL